MKRNGKKTTDFYYLVRADMRNGKASSNGTDRSTRGFAGVAAEFDSLRNGAAQPLIAPTSANGCVSEISSNAVRGHEHDYAAAMKSYGVVYEEYQSYLMPAAQVLPHDYDIAAKPVPDFGHLGCLNAELLDSTVQEDDISDDDIESCGYMAWVHH
ncbi:MAG TPA: hypothetical protein VFM32_03755 [Spongiibacteraceae bacterium]|nr:hypothetical protein [Spongiibacteraceae bacterium]